MRDDLMGGLLAFVIAAPIMLVCCGGGGVILAAILGSIGGWLTGFGGFATVTIAAIAMLVWRDIRGCRSRRAEERQEDTVCRAAGDFGRSVNSSTADV